jgi:hypothetical protein
VLLHNPVPPGTRSAWGSSKWLVNGHGLISTDGGTVTVTCINSNFINQPTVTDASLIVSQVRAIDGNVAS